MIFKDISIFVNSIDKKLDVPIKSELFVFFPDTPRLLDVNNELLHEQVKRGLIKTRTVAEKMPGIINFVKKYKSSECFKEMNILGCFTPTPETSVFILALKALGVNSLRWCIDNPAHTDSDIVAYLHSLDIDVFAKPNMTEKEYFNCMDQAMNFSDSERKNGIYVIDDGCDITQHIALRNPDFFNNVKMINENTTCGIGFIKNLYKENKLLVPAFDVNGCFTKSFFDNYHGVSNSFFKSYKHITHEDFKNKNITVFGYGYVGKGLAEALKKEGARVTIIEADVLKLLQAQFDGYNICDKKTALCNSDICITATGCIDTISAEDLVELKNSTTLCNFGQNNNEYNYDALKEKGLLEKIEPHAKTFRLPSGTLVRSL